MEISQKIKEKKGKRMYCPKCGYKLTEKDRFCSECGAPLSDLNSNLISSDDKDFSTSSVSSEEKKNSFKKIFPTQLNSNNSTSDSKKAIVIIGICSLAFLLIGGGVFYFGQYSPEKEAVSIFVSEVSSSIVENSYSQPLKTASQSNASTSIHIPSESSIVPKKTDPDLANPYITLYVMKIRAEPNYEGERLGRKEKGEIFEIIKTQEGPNSSLWGQLADGGWICLKDADLLYCDQITNTYRTSTD